MVLKTVILAGVDPTDILRRTMNVSILYAVCPAMLYLITESISGQFTGYKFLGFNLIEILVLVIGFLSYLLTVPVTAWIQFNGLTKISAYISKHGQILERQLIGALARVHRIAQITKMNLLTLGTMIGLIDCSVSRSSIGLVVYLVGQFLLIYNLPWPARCNFWMELKRNQVLS